MCIYFLSFSFEVFFALYVSEVPIYIHIYNFFFSSLFRQFSFWINEPIVSVVRALKKIPPAGREYVNGYKSTLEPAVRFIGPLFELIEWEIQSITRWEKHTENKWQREKRVQRPCNRLLTINRTRPTGLLFSPFNKLRTGWSHSPPPNLRAAVFKNINYVGGCH